MKQLRYSILGFILVLKEPITGVKMPITMKGGDKKS